MKLQEYMSNLNELTDKHPEYLDLEVVTASDDEGNDFNIVHYAPSVGEYTDREFICQSDFEDDEVVNAICVN